MYGRGVLCLLAWSVSSVICVFFHEPSAISLKPDGDTNPDSDFGFAMGYWKENLIVGSPNSGEYGEVHSCPIGAKSSDTNAKCSFVDFNITHISHTRDYSPKQKFYLGATIATTKNYFFTCAPLVTKSIKGRYKTYNDAFGSCFTYKDNRATEYRGPDFRFRKGLSTDVALMKGGTGWNTLADEQNGVLIVAKTSVSGDINYLNTLEPLKKLKSIKEDDTTNKLDKCWNIGYGITAGTFFSNEQTVIAFSVQSNSITGEIRFLQLNPLKKQKTMVFLETIIQNKVVGAMFGYTLAAADLNRDGLSELLVGAPAQSEDKNEVEYGALHIYVGGDIEKCKENNCRIYSIFGEQKQGRFGTAIAARDVDGDHIPEIFVSAPYEDTGVVYILSGYKLNQLLASSTSTATIPVSRMESKQRVQRKDLKLLGFSLQVVPDIDGNGCDELAMGAPGSTSVLLFRCLPNVNVTVTSRIVGSQIVLEKDANFTAEVCVNIGYKNLKSKIITGRISVKNEIIGVKVKFRPHQKPNFEIPLSERKENHCENITVDFSSYERSDYKLVTTLELINPDTILKSKDFDSSWVVLSSYSVTKKELQIARRCNVDDCNPDLSLKLLWSGPQPYELGSSQNETVSIMVKNDGYEAYGACLWASVTGAQVSKTDCMPKNGDYSCELRNLQRTVELPVDIKLNMTKFSNLDEEMSIVTRLYEKCDQEEYIEKELTIPYSLDLEKKLVYLDGVTLDLSITDKELLDEEIVIFKEDHTYLIKNGGSITWKDTQAIILVENNTYITKVGTSENDECKVLESEGGSQHKIECTLNLPPGTTTKIVVSVEMSKKEVEKILHEKKLIHVKSEMTLSLKRSDRTMEKKLETQIDLKKDFSWGNNKLYMILLAILMATVVLGIISFILYKNDFFKRQQKKKLDVLRETVRRRSIRLASESKNSQKTASAADDDHLDMEVVDDCAFEEIPVNSNDDVMLIESVAQVHGEEAKQTKE